MAERKLEPATSGGKEKKKRKQFNRSLTDLGSFLCCSLPNINIK